MPDKKESEGWKGERGKLFLLWRTLSSISTASRFSIDHLVFSYIFRLLSALSGIYFLMHYRIDILFAPGGVMLARFDQPHLGAISLRRQLWEAIFIDCQWFQSEA